MFRVPFSHFDDDINFLEHWCILSASPPTSHKALLGKVVAKVVNIITLPNNQRCKGTSGYHPRCRLVGMKRVRSPCIRRSEMWWETGDHQTGLHESSNVKHCKKKMGRFLLEMSEKKLPACIFFL